MKGSILPNHIPVNNYELIVPGLPALTPTTFSGIEEETNAIDLPDRTKVSGGNTNSVEATMMIPLHHSIEIAALEAWFREGQYPVTPTYKKAATLTIGSVGLIGPTRSYDLIGVWICKRKLPDLEMKNDGDMAEAEYMMYIDQILPAT